MKKTFKFLGIIAIAAIIGFSLVSCGGDDDGSDVKTSGKLTINGIPDANGKYVFAIGFADDDDGLMLIAAASVNMEKNEAKGAKVSGGKATLKVWALPFEEDGDVIGYNGSDEAFFMVIISDTETLSGDSLESMTGLAGAVVVEFSNGKAEGDFDDDIGDFFGGDDD